MLLVLTEQTNTCM